MIQLDGAGSSVGSSQSAGPGNGVAQHAGESRHAKAVANPAKRLAASVQTIRDPGDRLTAIFRTVFGRVPSDNEREHSLRFVGKGADRWPDLVHGLLMANEFAFVD